MATTYEQTIDLNEIFTITYKGIYDTPKAYIANGQTLVEKYSRKSEDIILPGYNRQDRLFGGWWTTSDETGEIVTKIPHNSNKNITLYAHWINLTSGNPVTIYVNPEAEGHYGFSEEYGLESLEAAMETIERVHDWVQTHDWTIKIKGELSGSHVITTEKSNVLEYAKSITLEGITDSGATPTHACLNGGYTTATEDAAVLSVQLPNPVIIKNLKITGGNNNNSGDIKGGGIYVADGSTVTLDDGTLITGNSASTGSGVYVSRDATLQMGGSAQVAANNDVYLSSGTKIEITNQFEGSIQHAGTITPEVYSEGDQVLAMAPNGSGALENECTVFKVTPQIEGDVTTNWEIDTEGKLALATSPNEFFVDTDGDNENSGLDAEHALKTIMAAIDKMNDSSTDYVINILGNIWQENMSDEYKLELTDSINGKANSITLRGTSNYEINGQAGEDPGTVMKVTTSVPIIIENITVTGGHATPYCLGGAIYIGEDSTVILGEGTIVNGGGDHGCGSAIYVAASENNGVTKAGTLIMKDDAVVTADNYGEIYLCDGTKTKVATALTGESSIYDDNKGEYVPSSIVGRITPQTYTANTVVLELTTDATSGLNLSDVCNKFSVTPQVTGEEPNQTTTSWSIDTEGKLCISSGGNSVPDGFVLVEGATITTKPQEFSEYSAFKYVEDEGPITIQNFYMCIHEVTQAEYETYCIYGGTAPSETSDKNQYPAYNISWYDAIVYCNLRSIAELLTPVYSVGKEGSSEQSVYPKDWDSIKSDVVDGKTKYCGPDERNLCWDSNYGDEVITINATANGYRLPTMAEWEYAARGGNGLLGTQTDYSGSSTLTEVSNGSYETIEKIMQHKDNNLGFYDMNSAVAEWCLDPSGEDDYRRVSTAQDPIDYNFPVNPNERKYNTTNLGFRVVRNAE